MEVGIRKICKYGKVKKWIWWALFAVNTQVFVVGLTGEVTDAESVMRRKLKEYIIFATVTSICLRAGDHSLWLRISNI